MSEETAASLLTEQGNDGAAGAIADVTKAETAAATTTDVKPTFMEQMSGDLKENALIAKSKDISELGQSYVDAMGKLDNAIIRPGEDADDTTKAAFLDALGRPETAEGYKYTVPEGMPENLQLEPDFLADASTAFHAQGFTQDQAESAINMLNTLMMEGDKEGIRAETEARAEAGKALNEAWGDKAKDNEILVNRAIDNHGGEKFRSFLKKSGFDKSPEFFMFAHSMASKMTPDTMMDASEHGTGEMQRSDSGLPMPKGMFAKMEARNKANKR